MVLKILVAKTVRPASGKQVAMGKPVSAKLDAFSENRQKGRGDFF